MIGGVVLLIGALVAVFVIVLRPGDHPVAPMTPVTQTIIPIDGSVSPVTLSGLTPLSARARLREAVEKANTPINTLYAIPLVDRGELVPEDLGAITVELTTDEFIRRVAPDAPAALRRALNPAFTFGVHAFQGDTAFLAFGVQSFEQAFAEMLLWERTLELDLGPVFRRSTVAPVELPSAPVVQEATTTATSTSSVGTTTGEVTVPRRLSSSRTRQFTDDVIANHDVRVLRNERGEPFMLYTFPNRSTLFIAGSKATLEELLRRLTTLQRE